MTAKAIDARDEAVSVTFDERVRPLIEPLTAYFARCMNPVDDAVDCVSETLIVLWRRRESLPTEDSDLRPYAYGVARGVLANHRRGIARRAALHQRLRDAITVARSPEPRTDDVVDVERALKRISASDRELLTLLAWDGLGIDEIALVLDIPPASARQRLKRARERLRRLLA